MTRKQEAAPGEKAATRQNNQTKRHRNAAAPMPATRRRVVLASLCEPCPGRSRDLVVTSACPWCHGRHRHQAAGVRRAGCGGGTYLVVVARTYSAGVAA